MLKYEISSYWFIYNSKVEGSTRYETIPEFIKALKEKLEDTDSDAKVKCFGLSLSYLNSLNHSIRDQVVKNDMEGLRKFLDIENITYRLTTGSNFYM